MAVLDGLAAEVCVEVRQLGGEDVEYDGERAGVGGAGDAEVRGLIGVVAEPGGGPTDEGPIGGVAVRLLRSGAGSVYGNLEVLAKKPGGKHEPIGAIKGIAVYPEVAERAASIALTRKPVSGETLEVRFTEDDSSKVVASADVDAR